MTLQALQTAKVKSMKEGNKARNTVLCLLIGAVQNATITPNGRVEATEELINSVLTKQAKIVKEQLDTCPASRPDLMEIYKYQLSVIEEFAPTLITNETEVEDMIKNIVFVENIDMTPAAKKVVMPKLKAMNVDMKVANAVFTKLVNAK